MEERTYNLIMACKGNADKLILDADTARPTFNKEQTPYDKALNYMAEEAGMLASWYTKADMLSILFDAVCDYMDTADRPSDVLRQCKTLSTNEKNVLTDAEKLAEILMQIRIKNDNGCYINGFGAYMAENAVESISVQLDALANALQRNETSVQYILKQISTLVVQNNAETASVANEHVTTIQQAENIQDGTCFDCAHCYISKDSDGQRVWRCRKHSDVCVEIDDMCTEYTLHK